MMMIRFSCCALLLAGCSSEAMNPVDSGTPDTSMVQDTGVADTQVSDAKTDTGSDAGCPASWTIVPVTDPSIALPDGGDGLLLHAFGTGTQNYACGSTANDAGTTYAWALTGPEADLDDCMMQKIGTHFASDGGPTRPEWMSIAGGYVIGKRLAAFTPDGGGGSVPWLLLQEVERGGTGPISKTNYVQRLNTMGGNAPATGCDQNSLGNTQKIPYTADYYFYGQ